MFKLERFMGIDDIAIATINKDQRSKYKRNVDAQKKSGCKGWLVLGLQ
jgi:hypothetical protein